MFSLLKSWSSFKAVYLKNYIELITSITSTLITSLAVCKSRHNIKFTSLQPNPPAFQSLQQQIPIMVLPLNPENYSSITCTVSTDTTKSVLLQTATASVNGVNCH